MSSTAVITVGGPPPYPVHVGSGALDDLDALLPQTARKLLIIHPPTLAKAAAALRERLATDREVLLAEIPDAEAGKRIEVAAFCWQVLGRSEFSRTDAIIGFGGGAVTDLAGFVAATWLRGVRVILIPTTVLGMVDAAIGGKTAVNTAEGKNLVGVFWPPHAVVCDPDLLASLPRNETVAGFAEVVKAGFIGRPEILDIIEADPQAAVDPASPAFRRCLELAVELKAEVVTADLREDGPREILNYGHTLGHAIEHAERYQWRHGAAVSIGMMFAAELSRLAGRLPDAAVERHRRILDMLGLPRRYRAGAWPQLLGTMRRDKKSRAGMLRFVVLDDVGKPAILQAPDESLLFAAYEEVTE